MFTRCGVKSSLVAMHQEARARAAKLIEQQAGMAEVSERFREMGGEVCVEAGKATAG